MEEFWVKIQKKKIAILWDVEIQWEQTYKLFIRR